MIALSYCRVSTDAQAESGISLEHQKRMTLEAIAAKGWEGELVVDSCSGKTIRRPGLTDALRRLKAGDAGALVVTKLDRLSRSVSDFYGLISRAQKEGWALVCLDPALDMSTAGGKAMAGMIAVFAEYEHDLISQRQKDSVAQRRRAGTYRPNPPLIASEALRRASALKSDGMSAEKICARLTLEGFTPPRGTVWHPRTVRRVLERGTAAP